MLCPCGCGRVLHMNLLPDERPCWRVTRHEDGSASLHPSVWRKKDCGFHFWFKKGQVKWCRRSWGLLRESVKSYAKRMPPFVQGAADSTKEPFS